MSSARRSASAASCSAAIPARFSTSPSMALPQTRLLLDSGKFNTVRPMDAPPSADPRAAVDPNEHDRFVLSQRLKLVINEYEFSLPDGAGQPGVAFCFVRQK